LKNLKFIFDTENLLDILALSLQEEPCDLIVIDAFTMQDPMPIHTSSSILNEYDKFAKT
jgi:hypothetical protein